MAGIEACVAKGRRSRLELVGVDGDVDDLSADAVAERIDVVVGDHGSVVDDDDSVDRIPPE